MNILGMGPMEILLIVVLALIVFGPAKLPEIMGQVGKAIGDFRRATSELSDEFNRTIQAELQETRSVVEDTKSAVTGAHASINSAISGTLAPVQSAAPANGLPAPNGLSADIPAANGTSVANGSADGPPSPPLANTTQWSWETAAPAPARSAGAGASAESVSTASGVGSDSTPPASDSNPPTASAPPAPSAPVSPVSRPPAPTRKSTTRDELLPPY